jgi:hypothetical protein
VEQFPKNANNCDAMMQAHYEAKNIQEAKKWMNELLALDPYHPSALNTKKDCSGFSPQEITSPPAHNSLFMLPTPPVFHFLSRIGIKRTIEW